MCRTFPTSRCQAIAQAYALNLPLLVTTGGPVPPAPLVSLVSATAGGEQSATVEAVKLADDRNGDVVVRVYESLGGRAYAVLRLEFPVARAEVVDLLERPLPAPGQPPLAIDPDGGIPLALRPFQILTVRLSRG